MNVEGVCVGGVLQGGKGFVNTYLAFFASLSERGLK